MDLRHRPAKQGDLLIARLADAMWTEPGAISSPAQLQQHAKAPPMPQMHQEAHESRPAAQSAGRMRTVFMPASGLFCPNCISGLQCAFHEGRPIEVSGTSNKASQLMAAQAKPRPQMEQPQRPQLSSLSSTMPASPPPPPQRWLTENKSPSHWDSVHGKNLRDDEDASTDVGSSELGDVDSGVSDATRYSPDALWRNYHLQQAQAHGNMMWARLAGWGIASR